MRIKTNVVLILLGVLLGFAVANAQNVSKTIYPTDDTYVFSNGGTENNVIRHIGSPNSLKSYTHQSDDKWSYKTYLKFDLSAINNNPEIIDKVVLRLLGREDQGSFVHTLSVYSLENDEWAEDELTYNTRTIVGQAIKLTSITLTVGTSDKYFDFDITAAVKANKATGKNKLSLLVSDDTNVRGANNAGSIISFYSKEAYPDKKPGLVVEEKDVTDLKLQDIRIDGETIGSFNPDKYNYTVDIDPVWNVVPEMAYTVVNSNAIVSIVNAVNLTGTEEERTTVINISKDGLSISYRVTFLELPVTALLESVSVDGKKLEYFEREKYVYELSLPYSYGNNIPQVTYTGKKGQNIEKVDAVNVSSNSINERTAVIKVDSRDGAESTEYKIIFSVLPKLDLYLCIGQSNMAGRGYMDNAKGDMIPLDNAFLFTPAYNFEKAGNPMNKYSNIRKELSMQEISPAWGFAKYFNENYGDIKTGMIVNARGGSAIEEWQKGQELYDSTVARAKEALKWGDLKAILWHQGESNTASEKVTAYPNQLKAMVDNFREGLSAPDSYFLAGELIHTWSNSADFNTMIHAIGQTIGNADWISAENLLPRSPDDVHFDRQGNITLGERYAEKVLNKVYGVTVPVKRETRVFFDDFERGGVNASGTPTTYTIVKNVLNTTPDPASPAISGAAPNRRLQLWNNGKANSGSVFVHGSLSSYESPFTSKIGQMEADSIVWSFNFRHTYGGYATGGTYDDSGFGQNQNGLATVLVADGSDIARASGYAVVAGDKTYGQRYRLVRFENGLDANSKLTNIAISNNEMSGAVGGADYHGIKVTYIRQTNTWRLYFKAKEQSDIADVSIPLVATGSDATLVNTGMTHFGFLNNYNSTAKAGDRMVFWDNYSVKVFRKENAQPVLDAITVNSETIEHYNKAKLCYTYYLPYTHLASEIPQVNYVKHNSNQQVEVRQAVNLTGNETDRTTVLKVTEGIVISEYKVVFKILPKMDIFLCLGQSNMSGYGELLNDDQGIIENTYLLTPEKRFENAENPLNKYSTIYNDVAKISPAYGFAKALIGKTQNPVGLLVNARNGSSIKDWGKANESNTDLYTNTLARAKEAQKWGDIKAIIWHQGESDSWQYQSYPGLIASWVNNFRTDLGDVNNNIFFVAGELAYWRSSGTSQPFNNLLHGISGYIPNSDWVSADGLSPWKDETDPHFNRQSAITLGEHYAEKVIAKSLPVKLISFTAKKSGNEVKLNWSTASEKNSSHFDVLRSSDGKNFLKIGNEIKSAGNADSKTDYSFTDRDPLPSVNYYKLQQFDKDGKSEFFGPVQLTTGIEKTDFNIYVSKTGNVLQVGIYSQTKQSGKIKVLDMNGKVLVEQGLSLDKGNNKIILPVGNLRPGVHVVILNTQEEGLVKKFLW